MFKLWPIKISNLLRHQTSKMLCREKIEVHLKYRRIKRFVYRIIDVLYSVSHISFHVIIDHHFTRRFVVIKIPEYVTINTATRITFTRGRRYRPRHWTWPYAGRWDRRRRTAEEWRSLSLACVEHRTNGHLLYDILPAPVDSWQPGWDPEFRLVVSSRRSSSPRRLRDHPAVNRNVPPDFPGPRVLLAAVCPMTTKIPMGSDK